MCPHGVAAALPTLFEAMVAQKWQTNEGACKMVQVCVSCDSQGALGGVLHKHTASPRMGGSAHVQPLVLVAVGC